MKAVLLAAGHGTRLAPLTDHVPKILVEIAGEPLLARQLRYLAAQGMTDVAINLHHLAEQVRGFLAAADVPLSVHVFDEPELLGTAGALGPMRAFLDEPFVLLYGDVVTDLDLRELYRARRGTATLVYYVSTNIEGKGIIDLDAAGRVTGFVEKPESVSLPAPINAGIHVLEPAVLDLVPERGDFGYDVWPALVADGALFGYGTRSYVADIGSIEMLRQVEGDIRAGAVAW